MPQPSWSISKISTLIGIASAFIYCTLWVGRLESRIAALEDRQKEYAHADTTAIRLDETAEDIRSLNADLAKLREEIYQRGK